MDTLNTGFIWEYDDNSFEEKNLLIDLNKCEKKKENSF